MADLITPRTLSGFRDYKPDVMLARERVLQTARDVYRSYGFTPIDTPACEALDVLLGKGGEESDKLVYRVRSARSEKEEMGLRFDLTVPLARFVALTAIGSSVWNALFIGLGYAAGDNWDQIEKFVQPLSYLALLLLAAAGVWLVVRRLRAEDPTAVPADLEAELETELEEAGFDAAGDTGFDDQAID